MARMQQLDMTLAMYIFSGGPVTTLDFCDVHAVLQLRKLHSHALLA